MVTERIERPGKKSKRKDQRPARKRYWMMRVLESRKVRHLMKCCRMSKQSAYNTWHRMRKGRVPEGYLDRFVGKAQE